MQLFVVNFVDDLKCHLLGSYYVVAHSEDLNALNTRVPLIVGYLKTILPKIYFE